MITIQYKQAVNKLEMLFDIAIPEAQQDHSEFTRFTERFDESASVNIDYKHKAATGLQVTPEHWFRFCRSHLKKEEAVFHEKLIEAVINKKEKYLTSGLEVNFHQKIFDQPDRYWNFILNQGHFTDYVFNRIHWNLAPRYKLVAPMPLHVDIETANTCNMNCPMCYREMMSEVGQMDFDLFAKIVDECAEKGIFSIRLSWRGESLTHPRIKEMIAYATSRIKNVSTLTNAFYIDDEIIDCVIQNRLSYLAVSFDGIRDNYNLIRHPARFEDSFEKLRRLRQAREQAGAVLPQVRLCTIWPAIRDNPDAYYQTMYPVSDYIVYNPYINFKGEMIIKPDFICQYPWERLVVAFNGTTQCCTGWNAQDIVLGNARDETLESIWHSELLNRIRDLHAAGKRLNYASCAACRHGSQGDPNIDIRAIVERRY